MKRKMVSAVTLTLLLTSMLTFAFHIEPVKASGTIYIMADGSIDPPTAPIFTMDNITYTITANISESIVVERDNIVVDGAGYTVTGSGVGPGIFLQSISNVTVKNTVIRGIRDYYDGIALAGCYACILSENNLSDNTYSIGLFGSSNITLRNNHMSGQYNFRVDGCELQHFIHDVDDSNMVNGKPVYYFINRQNESFSEDAGYLAFVNSTNIAVENLSLTGNGEGLLVAYSQNLLIKNVSITDNYYGVSLKSASYIVLSGNSITNNGYGIILEYSSNNNSISENNIINNGEGIALLSSSDNSISENKITNNSRGIVFDHSSNNNSIYGNNVTNNDSVGINLLYSSDNSISENNVANNSYAGIYLCYSNNNSIFGNTITNHSHGIDFARSSNNVISGNVVTNNTYQGIELYENSLNNSIFGNTVTNNQYGIWLHHYSDYNYVAKNTVTNNTVGIRLSEDAKHNRISENDILANGIGIGLVAFAENNLVYHNNFINNTDQVDTYPWISNVWDSGYPSGGNYWSDYTGVDTNGDGIGDTPYVIDVDNQDRYPLMHPWSPLPIHNINTGLGYATIQEAINAPETLNGHTIFVEAGTYYENVVVNKTVSLIGEKSDIPTLIDGRGIGMAFDVKANYVVVNGFTIQNSGLGIYVYSQIVVTIQNNTITKNANGIFFFESYNSIISGNDILNNEFGIYLCSSSNNSIIGNNVDNNYNGIRVLDGSSNNNIVRNNLIDNRDTGIGVSASSTNNSVIENNFINNDISLWDSSDNNSIYHNNFINNTNHYYPSDSVNVWDDGYPSGGNYWSDYVGVDVKSGPGQDLPGSDGIGDMPYIIDADNVDHYPLMNPYGAPPPQSYSLTITATVGGTTDPAPGTYSYTADSSVKVAAIPNANYLFDHWELDSVNVGSANPYTVLMDRDHTLKAVFSLILPPLSVSISPLSVSILVGQSVTFTSNVSGGYTPYSYQWYLNGVPVSGATSNTWTFTPATAGIYYVYLKVTDAKGNTAQSDTARVTVAAVPVGGYSIPIQAPATATPLTTYLILTAILTIAFTTIKHKITKKTKKPP